MSEWRELTGDALNFYVAERRGDVVKHWDEATIDWYESRGQTKYGDWLEHWIVDADGNARPVPDVYGDVNEALALWPVEGCYLGIECFDDEWTLAAYAAPRSKEVYVPAVYAESFTDKAALAYHVTRAWCAVTDAKEGVS